MSKFLLLVEKFIQSSFDKWLFNSWAVIVLIALYVVGKIGVSARGSG